MKQICSSVISEGGYELKGTSYSVTNGVPNYQTLGNAGDFSPSISLRLNSSYLDQIATISEIAVLMQSNTNMQYKLLLNPTTLTNAGALTWTNSASGRIQYNTDATTVTGGIELLSGYISSGQALSVNGQTIQLGRKSFVQPVYVLAHYDSLLHKARYVWDSHLSLVDQNERPSSQSEPQILSFVRWSRNHH